MSTGKKRPIHQYSEQALAAALKDVKENRRTIREASRLHNVPKTTILDRIHGRIKITTRKMGPPTVLTSEEEHQLCEWLKELARKGFPQKKNELLDTVEKILTAQKRTTIFKDNRPGQKWYMNFLKRHPDLALREPEGLSKARAIITENQIRKWFDSLEEYLISIKQEGILKDPRRVLNGDETAFSMCPKTGRVLAPKGWKNVYEVKKSGEKETLTVLLVFSAAGETLHPMVVFPYVRMPASVVKSIPLDWYIGKTESGWMRCETFYEYIANGVDKWLTDNEVPRPVILFVDGHKSHLSYQLSQFCDEHGIILYSLPPNTTHIMQPADVSVFKPLKSEWKKTVRHWQAMTENSNCTVNRNTFCPLLETTLSMPTLPETIRNGFKRCGLFPFDPNAVDYTKCISTEMAPNDEEQVEVPRNVPAEDIKVAISVLKKYEEVFTSRGISLPSILEILENPTERPASSVWETFEVQPNGELLLPLNVEADEGINEAVVDREPGPPSIIYMPAEHIWNPVQIDESTAHTENDILPIGNDGLPTTEKYVIATKETELPTEPDVLPAEEDVIPTEETELPTKHDVLPTEEDVIPTEETALPTEHNVLPTEKGVISSTETELPTEHDVLPIEKNLLSTETDSVSTENPTTVNTETTAHCNGNTDSNELILLDVVNIDNKSADEKSKEPYKSFQDHLFWPEPIQRKRKTASKDKSTVVAAVSSAIYRKYLEEKENKKKSTRRSKREKKT